MNSVDTDLEALFNRLADGIASDADEQRLADLLRSSPEARRVYREFMALHSALHWDYVAAVSPELPQSVRGTSLAVGLDSQASENYRVGWFAAFVAGAIVASVAAVAVFRLIASSTADKPTDFAVPAESDVQRADPIAALLVDEAGAEFAEGRAPDGVRFSPGEYELLKGIVHLRFAQGADVVLASPARLDVKDAQHTRLAYGKIRVTAPPTAKGFTVATDAADFVDLGTEFGLRVDASSGASDLYVFDGQVNVADPRSGTVVSEVDEGESSRYVDGAIGAAPELNEEDFPTSGSIGFQRWQQYEQEMRQDRGLLAFFPFRRAADESVLVDGLGNQTVPAGQIVGARWVSGRWPGKEALLFDRDTDCVQIDIPGEHRELTIAVWLKVDRLDFGLNAILNSDGYEPGDVHFQLTRQGLPRGGVVVEGGFHERIVGNAVPVGKWAHVVSVLSVPARSQRIYVNGVLARERDLRGNEIIRPGSCRLGNWLPAETVDPSSRAFRGRVDELAIWNRALSEDEVRQLTETGRPGLLWSEE